MKNRQLDLIKETVKLMLNEMAPPVDHHTPLIQAGVMVPWPKDSLKIPYGKSEGVGPGEQRLAFVLGGKVMNTSVGFDIQAPTGKYEVKEPKSHIHGEFRVGTSGTAALGPALKEIRTVVAQLMHVFGEHVSDEIKSIRAQNFSDADVARVQEVLDGDELMLAIVKGTIGIARTNELGSIVLMVHNRLKNKLREEKYVVLGNSDHSAEARTDVTDAEFVRIAKELGVSFDALGLDKSDQLRSELSHPAFTNPREFIKLIKSPVKPSDVFDHVDFLALVSQVGYVIIPKSELDRRIEYYRMGMMRPEFKFKS